MSTLFDSPKIKPRQRNALREQVRKAVERIPTDGITDDWAAVYIPSSHLQALDPQRMVVVGMRGSGKSFWTGILTNHELRKSLSAQEIGFDLKDALSCITQSYRIALDRGMDTNFPRSSQLESLLALPKVRPEIIWLAAIWRLFPPDPALGVPIFEDGLWSNFIEWAGKNPEQLWRGFELLEKKLISNQDFSLVVIDAIDCVSHDFSLVSAMGSGLLRVLLDLRFAKGLRVKAFFREDVLARVSPSVVDSSKLINNKVVLQWSQAELYGLAFHRIAQRSTLFRDQFKQITNWAWKSDKTGRQVCDMASSHHVQQLFWRALVGDYMGSAPTKGHSYPYLFNHLSDGLGRVAPRTFLVALKDALEIAVRQYSEEDFVIHPDAIKNSVHTASSARAKELEEEYAWIAPALQCIQPRKETVPIDRSTLEAIWLDNNEAVLKDIEAMRDTALIPWPSNASTTSKIESLRSTLEQIGIIKSRMKGNCERIEIPDIYRLAYKIGRKGGISTRKKS